MNQQTLSAFIWSVADLLRGDYKQSDYGKVILPFTVLRRLDCVLEAISRIFDNEAFGYHSITVERPLRDDAGEVVLGQKGKQKGKPQPDSSLRDTENVPLGEDIQAYFEREVLPHAPDAWIDHEKSKVGYEIPFNRHFYVFEPPRSLHVIDEDLKAVSSRIMAMLGELAE